MSVCLSGRMIDEEVTISCERILMKKFFGEVGAWPTEKSVRFHWRSGFEIFLKDSLFTTAIAIDQTSMNKT